MAGIDLRGLPAAPLMRTSRGKGSGQTEENQHPAISALIKAEGMREVEGWSVSASAWSDNEKWAKVFEQIKEDFQAGRFRVIVIRRINRFSRRAKLGFQRLWELQALGIHVISVEDPEFGVDNAQEFTLSRAAMKLELAETESAIKSKATREGFRDDSPRGRPPTGYLITGDKRQKHIVESDRAQDVIDFITDVSNGVPAYKAGGQFPRPTRVKIMAHDCYSTGVWEVNEYDPKERDDNDRPKLVRTLKFKVPVLVDRETHLRAREEMAGRSRSRNGKANSKAVDRGDYSSAVWCECGKVMYAAYQGQVKRYYYKCAAGHSARTDNATAKIDQAMSESIVLRTELRWDDQGADFAELRDIEDRLKTFDPINGDLSELQALRTRKSELETSGDAEQAQLRPVRSDKSYGYLWRRWDHARRMKALETEVRVTILRGRDHDVRVEYPTAIGSAIPRVGPKPSDHASKEQLAAIFEERS